MSTSSGEAGNAPDKPLAAAGTTQAGAPASREQQDRGSTTQEGYPMTRQHTEPNATDQATARAIAAQQRKVTDLRFRVDGAKKDVQQLVDDLHAARVRERQLRGDLLVEETQLWRLRHPATGVVVGVDVHASGELTEVLEEHAHRALQGGAR